MESVLQRISQTVFYCDEFLFFMDAKKFEIYQLVIKLGYQFQNFTEVH